MINNAMIDINDIDPWSIDGLDFKNVKDFAIKQEKESQYKKISDIRNYNFTSGKRHVMKVFIHHSELDNEALDNVESIAWIHKNHKFFSFSDIGYHFFISKDGSLYSGRNIDEDPSSQYGFNKNTISICVSGKKGVNKNQKNTIRNTCHRINELYERNISFHGHCELFDEKFAGLHFKNHRDFISYKNRGDGQYVNSKLSCPGFDYISLLKLDEDGYIK
jgi:hypothetical protein